MAIRLPIDRSVVVTITREDQFPTTTGFNTALLLTPTALAGQVDATRRTKLYSNVYEVGLEWPTVSETYKAAARFFQAKVRPPQLKIGYYDPTADMAAQINLIYQADPDWFWLFHSNELNDKAAQRDLADWAESHEVILALDSNDTDTELPGSVDDVTFTATISQASPAVVTKTGHSLVNGDPVRFTTSGVLPAPLSITETYFVIGASANTFTVASTQGGPAIATTDAGTGTHTAISPRFGGSIAEYVETKAYDRTAVFYHTDPASYLGAAAFAYACGRNLDQANVTLAARGRIDSGRAYTLNFKNLPGVVPINRGSAAVQAITGFIPAVGSNREAGHRANTYVNMGGLNHLKEGTVGSGAFIDEIHAISWLKARTQEAVFGVLSNTARVPYTPQGLAQIISGGINPPMQVAFGAGIIAPQLEDDGTLLPQFEVTVDDPSNVPVSQRRNRIAPDIKVVARLANAIHFVSVDMTLRY